VRESKDIKYKKDKKQDYIDNATLLFHRYKYILYSHNRFHHTIALSFAILSFVASSLKTPCLTV